MPAGLFFRGLDSVFAAILLAAAKVRPTKHADSPLSLKARATL
jgi:hypothetical protein